MLRSLKTLRQEQNAARDAQEMRDRYGSARVFNDMALEHTEAALRPDEKYLMDLLYQPPPTSSDLENRLQLAKLEEQKLAERDRVRQAGHDQLPAMEVPHTAAEAEEAYRRSEIEAEEKFLRNLEKLTPTMQNYIQDCDAQLKSFEIVCLQNEGVSVESVREHRKMLRANRLMPDEAELERATAEMRQLSLEPGGRVKAWRAQKSQLNAIYKRKHNRIMPPAVEEQAQFLWEQSRDRAGAELPLDLRCITTSAKSLLSAEERKVPLNKLINYVFNPQQKKTTKQTHQTATTTTATTCTHQTPLPPVPRFYQTDAPAAAPAPPVATSTTSSRPAFSIPPPPPPPPPPRPNDVDRKEELPPRTAPATTAAAAPSVAVVPVKRTIPRPFWDAKSSCSEKDELPGDFKPPLVAIVERRRAPKPKAKPKPKPKPVPSPASVEAAEVAETPRDGGALGGCTVRQSVSDILDFLQNPGNRKFAGLYSSSNLANNPPA